MNVYVYIVFDYDGVPRYVGVGRGNRWRNHNMNCSSAHPDLKKIRAANGGGELPIVIIRDGLTTEQALLIEAAFIDALGRQRNGGPLVNRNNGGGGPGDEGAEKLRQQRLGVNMKLRYPEACERIRQARIGKKHTPETKAAISAAHKGRVFTDEWRAKLKASRMLQKRPRRSEESRQKIREITAAYWAKRKEAGLSLSRPRQHQ